MKRFLLGLLAVCILSLTCGKKGTDPPPPPVPQAPVFLTFDVPTFIEGERDAIRIIVADVDSDSLSISYDFSNLTGLPTHVETRKVDTVWLKLTFNQDGQWSAMNSPFELNVHVSDGELTTDSTRAVIVTDVNRSPRIQAISDQCINLGDRFELIVLATDPDDDQLNLNAIFDDIPGATFVDNGDNTGLFEFTPSSVGVYPVMFIASDRMLADSLIVSITVTDSDAFTYELAWDDEPVWGFPFRTNDILYHAVWFDVIEFGLDYPINLNDINVNISGEYFGNFFVTYEDINGVPDLNNIIFNGNLYNSDTSWQWISALEGVCVTITQPFYIVLEGYDDMRLAGDLGDQEGGEFQDASITYIFDGQTWDWYFIVWYYNDDEGEQVWIGKSDYCIHTLVSDVGGLSTIYSGTSSQLKNVPTIVVDINRGN